MASATPALATLPTGIALNHVQDNPTPGVSELYGYEVETFEKYAWVGAKQDDTGAHNAGIMYKYNTHTGAIQLTVPNPFPNFADHFGDRIAMVGENVAAGVHYNDRLALNTGAVYLFGGVTGTLLRQFYSPTPDEGDLFGYALTGIDSEHLMVGAHRDDNNGFENAGAAYLFSRRDSNAQRTFHSPNPQEDGFFGISMTEFCGKVAIGSHYDDTAGENAGAVYIFDPFSGALLDTLTSPHPTVNGKFGWAMDATTTDLIIGAFNDDTGNGNTGAVYTYDCDGNLQLVIESPVHQDDARFGFSVSPMGREILVGAPGVGDNQQGAAFLFDNDTGNELGSFESPNAASRWYGYSVSSAGPHNIVIGAPRDSTTMSNSGYAFMYGGTSTIRGSVWDDESNDGIRNHVEYGIDHVRIDLFGRDAENNRFQSRAWTNRNGFYEFGNLPAGHYRLIGRTPAGFNDGKDAVGTLGGTVVGNDVLELDLGDFEVAEKYNFGELSPARISGYVYADRNFSGDFEPGDDDGIGGVLITLSGTNDLGETIEHERYTAANGFYIFNGLRPGTYSVVESQPFGYDDGLDSAGSLGGSVGPDSISGIVLESGLDGENYNFGEYLQDAVVCEEGDEGFRFVVWGRAPWADPEKGLALLGDLPGGLAATDMSTWLATTFPDLWGSGSPTDLSGFTNEDLYNYIKDWHLADSPQVDFFHLALAMSVYVTDLDLAGNNAAENYNLAVDSEGSGALNIDLGGLADAFDQPDYTVVTSLEALQAAATHAVGGVIYGDNAEYRNWVNDIFFRMKRRGFECL